MPKRRLTRRQEWRIRKVQEERLARARRKAERVEADLSDSALGPEQTGTLLANYGAYALIEDEHGEQFRCVLRSNLGALVSGDRVIWQAGSDRTGVIVAVESRRTLLARPDTVGQMKPIAANIDQIIIVTAPRPGISEWMIDRYLVAAETTHIAPIIVVNKRDLMDEAKRGRIEARMAEYRAIGYTVLFASTKREHGLDELREHLRGRTSVFVGQSGVGKSSLINALLPGVDARVGELSEASGQGRHTTSAAMQYRVPGGGSIIDSPGIRDFGLWNITPEQAYEGFVEFRPYHGQCRFRNCAHRQEPGCALQEAVAEGHISERRLESYHQIVDSLAGA